MRSESFAYPSRHPRGDQQRKTAAAALKAAEAEAARRKRAGTYSWPEDAVKRIRQQAGELPSMQRDTERQRSVVKDKFRQSFERPPISDIVALAAATAKSLSAEFDKIALEELPIEELQYESSEVEVGMDACSLRQALNKDKLKQLDDLINTGLDHASADRARGRKHTGVRAFKAFCADILGVSADRPLDPLSTSLVEKLEEEWLCMRFVCALVQDRGITPSSAAVYFSAVQGWHAREHGVKLCAGLKLERLPQMLKGLRRIIGEEPRAVRRGIAPQMLKRAMDMMLDPASPRDANIRAALATALQGLMRSREYCGQDQPDLVLMRSDVIELSDEKMVVMMHPCKNMRHIGGKTCPLVIGSGGTYVDAVAEVQNLMRVDPVAPGMEASTPLFRDPETNLQISYEAMQRTIKSLMAAIGEDPAQFGTHSLRIGGATALFAAGANETVIRTMGRWSSDLHRLYVRACFEQCQDWTKRAGSAKVSDLAGEFSEVDHY